MHAMKIKLPKNSRDLIAHSQVYIRWPRLSYLMSMGVYLELLGHGKNPDEVARRAGMREVQLGPNEIIGMKNKSEQSLRFFRHVWGQRKSVLEQGQDYHRWWNAGAWLVALRPLVDAVEPLVDAVEAGQVQPPDDDELRDILGSPKGPVLH